MYVDGEQKRKYLSCCFWSFLSKMDLNGLIKLITTSFLYSKMDLNGLKLTVFKKMKKCHQNVIAPILVVITLTF